MPTDERLIGVKQQIYKEAYFITIAICLASLIYKSYVLGLGMEEALTESLVLIVSALYVMMRSVTLGIVADEAEMHDRVRKWSQNRTTAVIGVAAGLILALYFGTRSAVLYGDETNRLWYFLSVFTVSLLIYVPFLAIAPLFVTNLARKASEIASKRNRD